MSKKITGAILGGFITVATFGVALGINSIGSAAEKAAEPTSNMMQSEAMNSNMMNSPEMQQRCNEMMANQGNKSENGHVFLHDPR